MVRRRTPTDLRTADGRGFELEPWVAINLTPSVNPEDAAAVARLLAPQPDHDLLAQMILGATL